MSHKVKMALWIAGGILAVLVIENKTGIFSKVFGKIPGVSNLLAA